jgi:hypothetical protein
MNKVRTIDWHPSIFLCLSSSPSSTSDSPLPPSSAQYCRKLGFPTAMFEWTDVLSTEEWALGMVREPGLACKSPLSFFNLPPPSVQVPKPVKAVVMLFPIKDAVSIVQCPCSEVA